MTNIVRGFGQMSSHVILFDRNCSVMSGDQTVAPEFAYLDPVNDCQTNYNLCKTSMTVVGVIICQVE